ncbi:Por secretion system C-terminal sorting domain-containing protein [Maribacter dokdonensis]|uniref:Por secretion system C-terminal sorting domain-containing protein n=1 Tax=Maribacter dokdonensis TaxID=320912 RepID=A0A1H4PV82_9FLAO|nr:T9SS type A sorting domain-containing protein [Maribacter dokdonensis]SEC11184.1 Por secretion system C-terminal sorting domain-containing protein [Maribacter dokdonensis]
MKRQLLLFTCSFSSICSIAQSIDRSVVASQGNTLGNADISLGFTVGEPLVGLIAGNGAIDQGFWTGYGLLIIPLSLEEDDIEILVYPNPVMEIVTVTSSEYSIDGMELFAINGQKVSSQLFDSGTTENEIDMTTHANGVYVLRLYLEERTEIKEYKLIKK